MGKYVCGVKESNESPTDVAVPLHEDDCEGNLAPLYVLSLPYMRRTSTPRSAHPTAAPNEFLSPRLDDHFVHADDACVIPRQRMELIIATHCPKPTETAMVRRRLDGP